jgi:TRAP-type C4-dicarboxylate transport system substrate-binding protein
MDENFNKGEKMKANMQRTIGAFALVTAVSFGASAQGVPPGPPVNIQIVSQPGPALPQFTKVDVPLLRDRIVKQSNNRITVTLSSWPERNLNGPEIIRLVRSGQVDIGAVPLGTVAGDVPLLDIVDLAGLNPTLKQARHVANAILHDVNKDLEKTGTRIIAVYPFPAQVFFCREPVTGLADLKGKKIRTFTASLNDLVTAFGAQPVSIGFPEVYAALERGVADCAITGTSSGNGARWYEVTRGLYVLPVGWAVAAYIVNAQWWDKLDPSVRGYLEIVMKEVEDAQWKLGEKATEDGIACNAGNRTGCEIGKLVENKPMSVTRATLADIQALRAALASSVLPNWVKRCGERCGAFYTKSVAPITGVPLKTN